MRATIILLCLFLSITSCNDSKKENDADADPNQNAYQNTDQNSDQNLNTNSKENASQSNEDSQLNGLDPEKEVETKKNYSNGDFAGTYINTDHLEDYSCQCFCLEVTSSTSELCLKEDDLFINASFQKNGENIEIYYSGKSSRTSNEEIPWDKFETGTPIAVLSPEPNGTMKLDWKGFSIDGKIAVDYALYGKKTLEGTYKKK
ncbi:hypothetical protein [Christiangramia echinicola]|uniref:Lipoprotein n=1 Tax=Christiangramia echinicola TaxID=279359 RepID=A0A1H1PFX8_9FLAO|nr:hypothetical protein [Christiangramia echinicola]SDS09987.1 hypothetical protein SAMN04488552_2095 [Christiangramia echinicola]